MLLLGGEDGLCESGLTRWWLEMNLEDEREAAWRATDVFASVLVLFNAETREAVNISKNEKMISL